MTNAAGPGAWSPAGSSWTLGTEGIGWLLYVPDGDDTTVSVVGDQQEPPVVSDDGGTRRWDGVVDENGRRLDLTVTTTVTAFGDRLSLRMSVDNRSGARVDSALFPWIRGVSVPAGRTLQAMTRDYYGAKHKPLWPRFEWTKGYYGTVRPTAMTDSLVFGNPTAPFVVMHDEQEAVAAWVAGPNPAIVGWMWELAPGYADTIGDRVAWPGSDAPPGELRFSAVHLLDLPPGESRALADIHLDHATGGWVEALAGYREHRRHAVTTTPPPEWAARPHTWHQIGMRESAGRVRYRFEDLPALAAECREAGVGALHVIGWNDGGQDRNNPSHDPAPDLGGADGLAAAITQCQDMGVRVVLFTKFTWADLATERFRADLSRLAVRDPYGDYYRLPGYQYLTPHQMLDVSTRRLVPMCFLSEDYLRVCEEEFDKVLATGADGMLYDEAMHHTPATLCYATDHGHPAGASVYAGDAELARRLRARVPDGREFLFAAETVYEDLQPSYQVSYIRSHYVDHAPLTRYVNPGLRMMTTVSGYDDRNQINQALAYGYSLCYEPAHYKGRLPEIPATVAYGQRAERLRTELADNLWHGTFVRPGQLPAGDGRPPLVTGAWRHADGERSLLVVANYDHDEADVDAAALGCTESRTIDGDWEPISGGRATVGARGLLVLR